MRRAARVDSNHAEIVESFRSLGWSVLNVSQLKNCCDIAASKSGKTFMIEIKDGAKPPSQRKLTSGEIEFKDRWLGEWLLIKSMDDVITLNDEI
jgi:Holliday junction resolvase